AAEEDDVRDLPGREPLHQPEVDVDREVEPSIARGEDRDEAALAVPGLHRGALVERTPDRVDVLRGPVVESRDPAAQDLDDLLFPIRGPQPLELRRLEHLVDLAHGLPPFTRVAG